MMASYNLLKNFKLSISEANYGPIDEIFPATLETKAPWKVISQRDHWEWR